MEAFSASLLVVVLAEMGDKTQLLAMLLAARYQWTTVMLGILAATLANHLIAVVFGYFIGSSMDPALLQFAVSILFICFGIWTLRGDKLEEGEFSNKHTPFWTTAIAFFMAEMGDKTQITAITLAAQYQDMITVLLGTTAGMMLADGAAVIAGAVLKKKLPEKTLRYIAAAVFILIGLYGFAEMFHWFG